MSPKSVREKSIEKTELLRDPLVSAAFRHYFELNWQAKRMLDELRSAGADIERLREWALYSFHSLGTDESEEKRKRGLMLQAQLKKALVGYENAIAFYSVYASASHFNSPESVSMSNRFRHLVELNQYLACEAKSILDRAATRGVYSRKRSGVSWQCTYLYLSKSYISRCMKNWDERKILGALTHLIEAAHKSARRRVPDNLRSLLRKALAVFESDPRNATIVGLLQKAASDPAVLSKMFPPEPQIILSAFRKQIGPKHSYLIRVLSTSYVRDTLA
jgi:hypothetical protein